MKNLHNEKGIALVTSLMFTVLSLVMTMALLYMVTSSIKTSGAMKRYKTTTEAAYGGMDIVLKDLIQLGLGNNKLSPTAYKSLIISYMNFTEAPNISDCLQEKLSKPKSQWSSTCLDVTANAKQSPDISFKLNAESGSPYIVYTKIVDNMDHTFQVFRHHSSITLKKAGNTNTAEFELEAAEVIGGSGVTVPHYPYMYRVEIQAERQQNPAEKAKLTVQYAY